MRKSNSPHVNNEIVVICDVGYTTTVSVGDELTQMSLTRELTHSL